MSDVNLPTDMNLLLEAIEQMMGERFARHMSDQVYRAFQVGQQWPSMVAGLEMR
jgi:hypothetical protein